MSHQETVKVNNNEQENDDAKQGQVPLPDTSDEADAMNVGEDDKQQVLLMMKMIIQR